MNKTIRASVVAVGLAGSLALVGAAATSVSAASPPDEIDTPISGPALASASSAALAHLGAGTVTDTEVNDEESYYEVEVTLENGHEIDVQLDEAFAVVSTDGNAE
ncbi:hypothetical protein [Salinibacterium sp.]|uniref:PepSY domain-containing protein n=1 Tax=Salinibacterium sp. TaxID=1915057 RepID=UPI00286D031E|nr:hypothetical protein [Salinibacterium sp.]